MYLHKILDTTPFYGYNKYKANMNEVDDFFYNIFEGSI